MLRAAVEAIRANKKNDARALLEKVLDLDEYNEQAWIWLSAVVESNEEKRTCLENVLTINPNNEQAKKGLKQLTVEASAPPAPVKTEPAVSPMTPAFSLSDDDDFFSDVSFNAPAASAPAWDAAATDDPWGSPTSSSSAAFGAPNEQSTIPDDWAASLVKKPNSVASTPSAFGDFDEDAFFNDAPAAQPDANPFGSDPFGADPFGSDSFGNDPFNSAAFDENDFDSMMNSPAPTAPTNNRFTGKTATQDFEEVISQPVNEDFGDLFADDMSDKTASRSRSSQTPREPEEYFAQIPSEIKAGRLPGEDQTLPGSARMMFIVAVLLNVGAFGFLILRAMG
jgi:hypothetical protein